MSRNVIQKLREKPKETKDAIALGAAGTVTALVFVVWITTTSHRFEQVVQGSKEGADSFSTFFNQAKEQMAAITNAIPDQASSTKASDYQDQTNAQLQGSAATTSTTANASSTQQTKRSIRIATTSSEYFDTYSTSSSPHLTE
jgi:hypothetical protein